jgi:hypothetical protein
MNEEFVLGFPRNGVGIEVQRPPADIHERKKLSRLWNHSLQCEDNLKADSAGGKRRLFALVQ